MEFVQFLLNLDSDTYHFNGGSTSEMCSMGLFFIEDIRCNDSFYREWVLKSTDGDAAGGNYIGLENQNGYIIFNDEYPAVPKSTELKMTIKQFVSLFDEWQQKVIKQKPKEVIIKHENNDFFIETTNDG